MRTTLNLDDQLLTYAKHQAIEESISLAHVIENALRESLAGLSNMDKRVTFAKPFGFFYYRWCLVR